MVQFLVNMGQHSSLPKGRRKSLRSFSRKSASQQNNLSHTFTINESDDRMEQLNVNIASEEELMTLAGVNREIAKSIVEHRKAIGRFRKVEDLALVRGVGADKLEEIRPEICVSTRRNQSCVSSRAQSFDSVRSVDSRLTIRSNKLVNVNRATVFELQTVHGITQEIAAAIVHYREKRGPFKQIDDLIKVKHIDRIRLDNISRFLTIDTVNESIENDNQRPSILTNGYTMPSSYYNKCNGGPLKLPVSNGLPPSSANDIFELLSAYSPRPILEELFKFSRNGERAVRIGTWNLHNFSVEKASNLGVKEVICRTILENGWSILAVQDVKNVLALKAICEELNKPKLRRINEWKDRNHNWNFCMLDVRETKLGFIYDSDGAVDIELVSLNEGPEDTRDNCEVLIASFRIDDLPITLVNIMLNKDAQFTNIHDKIKEFISEVDYLLVLIDFSNVIDATVENFLVLGDLKAIFTSNVNTLYASTKQSDNSIQHLTNILHNNKMHAQLTGTNGIVRHGITHLAIPNGWSWGGPVSPFSPIWTEIYLNPNPGTAL